MLAPVPNNTKIISARQRIDIKDPHNIRDIEPIHDQTACFNSKNASNWLEKMVEMVLNPKRDGVAQTRLVKALHIQIPDFK